MERLPPAGTSTPNAPSHTPYRSPHANLNNYNENTGVNGVGLAPATADPAKKGKFGKLGGTMANSAAGGVGFGAGAAIGSGIVRAIF